MHAVYTRRYLTQRVTGPLPESTRRVQTAGEELRDRPALDSLEVSK